MLRGAQHLVGTELLRALQILVAQLCRIGRNAV